MVESHRTAGGGRPPASQAAMIRRYPIGAEPQPDGSTHFRVWAPRRQTVEVVIDNRITTLNREPDGHHSGCVADTAEGALYRFRLDGADAFPDPASRFQPEGPHGPSQVVDPAGFVWTDASWKGATLHAQIAYELHIGTFTREGTFSAARRELAELASAGITLIEIMPVADFPGRFGWGYDGVGLFAPVAIYGRPDDFRAFVDEAHRLGVAVILDVVYNHVGPDGNYLPQYSEDYFTTRYENEWGQAINYDGPGSEGVREWVVTNAAYWADEYHLDGLRLDATQQIFDSSPENIMTSLARAMRETARARGRDVVIVAENERNETRLVRPVAEGGCGLDALWNDDYHHAARVAVTGRSDAYYTDYTGNPQELISSARYGYLFQGQHYRWQNKRRGAPTWGLAPAQFVNYIQNHDQIANSGRGDRLHLLTSPGRLRAITALTLLAPGTPMLFQGQEFAASSPFYFFADHCEHLRGLVREGRIQFLSQFRALAQPEMRPWHIDPGDPAAFERCKLDFRERETHEPIYRLHKDLLRLRRRDPVFRAQRPRGVDGAVLGGEAFVLRFFGEHSDDRLLLVNLGRDLRLESAPEPLLAPPEGKLWDHVLSTEDPQYGGAGTAPLDAEDSWRIPGHAAVVLRAVEPPNLWQT
jgi:maltooligosyltrehalose trehalohydrolase